ncbi:MAG TPA: hypothetical protein VGD34_17605 [Kribbella sp.]|jgi:hypothetical protein
MRASAGGRRARRLTVLLALCIATLSLTTAPPAAAHTLSANYVTAVVSVQPAVQGLEVSTTRDGSWLTITNRTARTVTVFGYEHDAYLKLTANGVWQNTRSPATYLNDDLTIGDIPVSANAAAAPEWQQISTSNAYRFHDHRIHWMGNDRPAVVAQNPGKPQLIKNWTIGLLVDGKPVTVNGTLSWVPSGGAVLWWIFGGLCVAIAIAFMVVMAVEDRRKQTIGTTPRKDAVDVWADLHANSPYDPAAANRQHEQH